MENHYTNDKSADFISYLDSAQLSGHFAITGGLVSFRHPRTDPAGKGCEQGRTVQWSCRSAGEDVPCASTRMGIGMRQRKQSARQV